MRPRLARAACQRRPTESLAWSSWRLRNGVAGEREFGAWTSVVGWLAVTVSTSEAECVVQERLQDIAGQQVGDVGVVVETVGNGLSKGYLEFRQCGKHLGDVVAAVFEHRGHRIEFVQGRSQLLLVVVDEARELLCHSRCIG